MVKPTQRISTAPSSPSKHGTPASAIRALVRHGAQRQAHPLCFRSCCTLVHHWHVFLASVLTQSNRLVLLKRLLDKFPSFRSTVNTPDLQGRTPLIWSGIKVGPSSTPPPPHRHTDHRHHRHPGSRAAASSSSHEAHRLSATDVEGAGMGSGELASLHASYQ